MIVSGTLGQHIIPKIHECQQLASIYVVSDNELLHEQWTKIIPKVKGVYIQIESICDALQIDRERCDRDKVPISVCGIEPWLMYTQLLKETIVRNRRRR
ncbi:unnamed protein product [Rotaria sp. Silwood2]|nr:unnamed protein product [Rotaria sp. Silwood2]CAF4452016.1 unnamed protein product [Rotaria sp. Silwood2]CAF4566795.1 unnamed protein product [Rotaria sp. Silwood2]